jgi:phi13 family phage major tail protein
MAIIGVRKPHVAKYDFADGAITYTDYTQVAKATEINIEIATSDSNDLYADDDIAESDKSFGGGTVTLTTDDLSQGSSALILGITPSTVQIDGETVEYLDYNDDQAAPDLGFGIIISKIKAGVRNYRALVLPKVKFAIPSDAATTNGKTIEWKTQQITGTIMRDESAKRSWKKDATFGSEEEALAFIGHWMDSQE